MLSRGRQDSEPLPGTARASSSHRCSQVLRGAGALVGDDPVATIRETFPRKLEKTLASVIAALAVLALMLMGRDVLGRTAPALLLGAIFALGTSLWSTVSRGLWQHGPLILLCALALLCLARGRDRDERRWPALAGAALAAGYAAARPPPSARPGRACTADRPAPGRGPLRRRCRACPPALLRLQPVGLWAGRDPVLRGERRLRLRRALVSPAEGLAGTLLSPARGLLVYSPFVLLAAAGVWMRRHRLGRVELVAIGSVLVIWLLASNTVDWAGRLELRPAPARRHPPLPRVPDAPGAGRGDPACPQLVSGHQGACRRPRC